jgi:hypothetical protein
MVSDVIPDRLLGGLSQAISGDSNSLAVLSIKASSGDGVWLDVDPGSTLCKHPGQ